MPQNKKHHFVPKFYLRNFSKDQKSIGIFNVASRRLVPGGNLSNQCYRDYFYGKDPKLEHAFSKMEGSAALVIKDLIHDREAALTPMTPEHIILSHFMVLQSARTAFQAEAEAEATDKFFRTVYSEQVGDLDGYRIGFENPILIAVQAASRVVPIVYDLKLKLLWNETAHGFITSDNPVVRHNQLFEGNDYSGHTGWGQAGLQVLLPLSRKVACLLYDGQTYKVGDKRARSVTIESTDDIARINALQWLNAHENVYFCQGDEASVQAQAPTTIPRRRAEKSSVSEHEIRVGKSVDKQSTILHEFRPGLNVRLRLSFMKLRRHPKFPRHDFRSAPVRDKEYLDVVERFGILLSKGKAKPEEFFEFAACACRAKSSSGQ
ncbi:DUF4238 domain-containing protein [Rhodopseudomonas sp. NSM]|uniref:DUF4238 domain-containing protein n=1 Tax=Rhodopseudomonas sp. NSM TaxID=3457630 RepID=UPI004035C360